MCTCMQELTARYGSYFSFSISVPLEEEAAAGKLVRGMCPGARLVYALGGTLKFELPVAEVSLDTVFGVMQVRRAVCWVCTCPLA